jgi:polysaccharide pyruvyl transferase WcaK-like protein
MQRGTMKRICVVGNFSGRNAGDAAILECLLEDVYAKEKNVEFVVPTINKNFVSHTYQRFPVKPVPLMPWNLSLKIFGLPIVRAVLQSDLVLLTDAILFDLKLLNPLYNYLSTMALILPAAKKKGIPIVLYNVSLGPINTDLGKACIKKVLDSSDQVILRDQESAKLLKRLNLSRNDLKMAADCALNVPLPDTERMRHIKESERILDEEGRYLSFNISSYLDVYVRGKGSGIGTERFTQIIVDTMDRICHEMKKRIVFVITQPMDLKIAGTVMRRLRYPENVTLISNKDYTHNDLAGVLAEVEMHVGMRTHSLIFATASTTPTVGIIATPKNRGYMKSIAQDDRMIEFDENFSSEKLFSLVRETWEGRKEIRRSLFDIMKREKEKAKASACYLEPYLAT